MNPQNQQKNILLPSLNDSRFAELLGMLAGDGHIGPHYIGLTLNAKADGTYAFFARNIMEELFSGATVTIHYKRRYNTHYIQLSSTRAVQFIKQIWPQRHSIPAHILASEELKIHFVRGLIDTEGSIGFKVFHGRDGMHIYRQLTFTNFNKPYVKIVYDVLKKLGFSPTSPARNIYISNKRDIDKYFAVVDSHNPKLREAHSVENHETYLAYRAEKSTIAWLFDSFGKVLRSGGVAEWL